MATGLLTQEAAGSEGSAPLVQVCPSVEVQSDPIGLEASYEMNPTEPPETDQPGGSATGCHDTPSADLQAISLVLQC